MKKIRIFPAALITLGLCSGAHAALEDYGQLSACLSGGSYLSGPLTNVLEASASAVNTLKAGEGGFTGLVKFRADYRTNTPAFSVDQAYCAFQNEFFTAELGKDRILYGVGYAWNPADILNPAKSPLYRDEVRRNADEGVFLATLAGFFQAGPLSLEARAVAVPSLAFEKTGLAASLKLDAWSAEALFTAGFRKDEPDICAGALRFSIPGLDLLTFYGEFRFQGPSSGWKCLAGLQVNPALDFLPGNLQFQAEYFRNFDGYTNSIDRYLMDNPGRFPLPGETYTNYLYAGASYGTLDFSLSAGCIFCLDPDGSGLVNFLMDWNMTGDCTAGLGGYCTVFNATNSEFPYLVKKNFEVYLNVAIGYDFNAAGNDAAKQ